MLQIWILGVAQVGIKSETMFIILALVILYFTVSKMIQEKCGQ